MGNYHPILMKIGTQTNKIMLSSKITKAEVYGEKTATINCKKNDIILKRQRCMSANLSKKENFLFAGRSFHTLILIQQVVRQSEFESQLLRKSAIIIFLLVY
jgi:hypothetical protein